VSYHADWSSKVSPSRHGVHDVVRAPHESLTFPSLHWSQDTEASVAANFPGPQIEQAEDSSGAVLSMRYFPATLTVQLFDAVPEYFPAAHAMQVWAEGKLNFPASQASQADDSSEEVLSTRYFPDTHAVQFMAAGPVYVPMAQSVQFGAARRLNFPAVHTEQVETLVAPDTELDFPASQSEQVEELSAPMAELYFPAVQFWHEGVEFPSVGLYSPVGQAW